LAERSHDALDLTTPVFLAASVNGFLPKRRLDFRQKKAALSPMIGAKLKESRPWPVRYGTSIHVIALAVHRGLRQKSLLRYHVSSEVIRILTR